MGLGKVQKIGLQKAKGSLSADCCAHRGRSTTMREDFVASVSSFSLNSPQRGCAVGLGFGTKDDAGGDHGAKAQP